MHEPDQEEGEDEMEDPEVDEQMDTGIRMTPQRHDDDNQDEYSTQDEPAQPSFSDRYGYDERDGPPEEGKDEERGYVDDPE